MGLQQSKDRKIDKWAVEIGASLGLGPSGLDEDKMGAAGLTVGPVDPCW